MSNNSDGSSQPKKNIAENMINMEKCHKQGRKSLNKLDAEEFSQIPLMSEPVVLTFTCFCHSRAFSSFFSFLLALFPT